MFFHYFKPGRIKETQMINILLLGYYFKSNVTVLLIIE